MVHVSGCLYPQLRVRSSRNTDSKVQSHYSTHVSHLVNIYACVFPLTPVVLLKFHLFRDWTITVPRKFLNIFTLSMAKFNWHRNHMVIAWASMHPVLEELRTLFLDGVTRSSQIIWSSVKINRGTNNCETAPPAFTSEIRIPFKQLRSKPVE